MQKNRLENIKIKLNETSDMQEISDRLVCRYVHQLIAK